MGETEAITEFKYGSSKFWFVYSTLKQVDMLSEWGNENPISLVYFCNCLRSTLMNNKFHHPDNCKFQTAADKAITTTGIKESRTLQVRPTLDNNHVLISPLNTDNKMVTRLSFPGTSTRNKNRFIIYYEMFEKLDETFWNCVRDIEKENNHNSKQVENFPCWKRRPKLLRFTNRKTQNIVNEACFPLSANITRATVQQIWLAASKATSIKEQNILLGYNWYECAIFFIRWKSCVRFCINFSNRYT